MVMRVARREPGREAFVSGKGVTLFPMGVREVKRDTADAGRYSLKALLSKMDRNLPRELATPGCVMVMVVVS